MVSPDRDSIPWSIAIKASMLNHHTTDAVGIKIEICVYKVYFFSGICTNYLCKLRYILIGGSWGPRLPLFEPSYRLVKTCFNRIFPISSLSFFFLPCFLIFSWHNTSVSFDFSLSKLSWNPICFLIPSPYGNAWVHLWYWSLKYVMMFQHKRSTGMPFLNLK